MVGSAKTLEKAKVGVEAEAELPAGGAVVWREFLGYLKERGLVISHDEAEVEGGEVREDMEALQVGEAEERDEVISESVAATA